MTKSTEEDDIVGPVEEKILDYLEGRLSLKDAEAFKAEIANDPSLAERVEQVRTSENLLQCYAEHVKRSFPPRDTAQLVEAVLTEVGGRYERPRTAASPLHPVQGEDNTNPDVLRAHFDSVKREVEKFLADPEREKAARALLIKQGFWALFSTLGTVALISTAAVVVIALMLGGKVPTPHALSAGICGETSKAVEEQLKNIRQDWMQEQRARDQADATAAQLAGTLEHAIEQADDNLLSLNGRVEKAEEAAVQARVDAHRAEEEVKELTAMKEEFEQEVAARLGGAAAHPASNLPLESEGMSLNPSPPLLFSLSGEAGPSIKVEPTSNVDPELARAGVLGASEAVKLTPELPFLPSPGETQNIPRVEFTHPCPPVSSSGRGEPPITAKW